MLTEMHRGMQVETEKRRRWFHDASFDLYTWESGDGALLGFQLCYGKEGDERALRCSPAEGYRHEGVDANEEKPGRAMSAIFVVDGVFNPVEVGAQFDAAAIALPDNIRRFVIERVRAYGLTPPVEAT